MCNEIKIDLEVQYSQTILSECIEGGAEKEH